MAQCVTCGAFGVIENPTKKEWSTACDCVRVETSRITIKQTDVEVSYVERRR